MRHPEARNAEAFEAITEHNGIKWHNHNQVGGGDLVEPIVEVDHIISRRGVKVREQLERLLEDAINMRSGSVGGRVCPEPMPMHAFVGGNYIVEARNDIIRCEGSIPTGLKVGCCDLFIPITVAVVLGMGKGGDIKSASLQLLGVAFAIHVLG
jgi:hypothetical protein